MRIILILLLMCSTAWAGYEEGDPTSVDHRPNEPYYGLYNGSGYSDASYGQLVTSEQYDLAKTAYLDGLKDYENWRPQDKAMMKTMYHILKYLGYPETPQQFKQRIKDNM